MTRTQHNGLFVLLAGTALLVMLCGLLWSVIASQVFWKVFQFLSEQSARDLMFFGGLFAFLIIIPIGKFCERFITDGASAN